MQTSGLVIKMDPYLREFFFFKKMGLMFRNFFWKSDPLEQHIPVCIPWYMSNPLPDFCSVYCDWVREDEIVEEREREKKKISRFWEKLYPNNLWLAGQALITLSAEPVVWLTFCAKTWNDCLMEFRWVATDQTIRGGARWAAWRRTTKMHQVVGWELEEVWRVAGRKFDTVRVPRVQLAAIPLFYPTLGDA